MFLWFVHIMPFRRLKKMIKPYYPTDQRFDDNDMTENSYNSEMGNRWQDTLPFM